MKTKSLKRKQKAQPGGSLQPDGSGRPRTIRIKLFWQRTGPSAPPDGATIAKDGSYVWHRQTFPKERLGYTVPNKKLSE